MFNGIIFNQGVIKKVIKRPKGINLFVKSKIKLKKGDIGISISCDGVCLTLISLKSNYLEFYLSNETLNRSKFKNIKINDKINLETPLKYGQKISGHICQGHVDGTAKLINKFKKDKAMIFEFSVKKNIINQLVNKASILINGVSLTISKITKAGFEIWLIPHTLKLTNLSNIKKNSIVNIEFDILSKYVKHYLS